MTRVHDKAAWRKVRLAALERDLWTCRMCGVALSSGKTRPDSAVVDHIRPHHMDIERELDPSNLQSVCKSCHDGPCRSIEDAHRLDVDAIERAKIEHRHIGLDGRSTPVSGQYIVSGEG